MTTVLAPPATGVTDIMIDPAASNPVECAEQCLQEHCQGPDQQDRADVDFNKCYNDELLLCQRELQCANVPEAQESITPLPTTRWTETKKGNGPFHLKFEGAFPAGTPNPINGQDLKDVTITLTADDRSSFHWSIPTVGVDAKNGEVNSSVPREVRAILAKNPPDRVLMKIVRPKNNPFNQEVLRVKIKLAFDPPTPATETTKMILRVGAYTYCMEATGTSNSKGTKFKAFSSVAPADCNQNSPATGSAE